MKVDAYLNFIAHLQHIGELEYAHVRDAWQERKRLSHTHTHDPMFVPVLPWILWFVLYEHNLRSPNTIEMKVERTFGLDYWMNHEDTTDIQRSTMINTKFWGRRVEEITIVPAMYCYEHEIVFAKTLPENVDEIMMAVQLIRQH